MSYTRLLSHASALGIGLSAMLASGANAALPCIEMPDGCRVALDRIRERHGDQILAFRVELTEAAERYGPAVELASYYKRLGQLDKALPWVVDHPDR